MKVSSKYLILFLFGFVCVSCAPKQHKEVKKTSKPNIILFVADDHGKDALGSYGNKIIQTPNLDKMASEGVRFNNAYCTSASCAASRSVILTGKFGHATGSYGHVHDYHHFSTYDNVKSLPVLLEQAGYETARIGKYHVAPEKVYHFNTVLEADPRSTLEMADACVDVLKSEKPFFLYFCTDDPHRGHPFVSDPWNLPNTFGNKKEPYPGEKQVVYDPKDVIVPDFLPDTKESREEIAQYYQSISRIDQGFGQLMKHLQDVGKLNNTIVFYISDNGMAFPGAKTTVYEPGIQLPCIVKNPMLKENKGGVNNAKISWVDLTPTILEMANVDYDTTEFHGKSFDKIIGKENPKGWDEVYASHTFHEITMYYPMRVAIEGKYKLIWNIAWQLDYPFASDLWASSTWQSVYRNHAEMYGNKTVDQYLRHAEFELFDLDKDPGEVNNLVEKKEYQEVLIHMKSKLKKFQLNTKDPWLIMWNHDNTLQGTGVDL
ncbi:sulfatase [Wenyingzhuangia sp. 2_MG-2023]|uniref:sulfatase family protein n=1 Tax=Wenyingzhuangia sp. 2_MG-2023 TaxID=3062639 RepID=UPI0026E24CCE|nr:sulfatase [Wenyingzhuangia sp. 2_MG-2023]MDO6737044.1 sulfatase [Wenyingzhuangia sp. 2_MG-2023]MDO6801787.1 sulfatase [Wenyingzhuangia sp. 1_MG-2023]